jgi:hypothetical protein
MRIFGKMKQQDTGGVAVVEPPAATPSAELSAVQADLDDIQRERGRLEEESRILSERLVVIAARADELKVEMASCAGGSGTSALDALDRERVELQRKREGIQILVERTRAIFDRYHIVSQSDIRDAARKVERARAEQMEAASVSRETAQESSPPSKLQ